MVEMMREKEGERVVMWNPQKMEEQDYDEAGKDPKNKSKEQTRNEKETKKTEFNKSIKEEEETNNYHLRYIFKKTNKH